MPSNLSFLCVDAHDPEKLARFWAAVLERQMVQDEDGDFFVRGDDTELPVYFLASEEPRRGPNQMHFDLTSTSSKDQQAIVTRALKHGAEHLDIGQGPDAQHVVLQDPEGNEFCVIPPGNAFLADTGTIGALSCDGTRAVGLFWSEVLGWPLVWDQDEETAIQSPSGGTKISWGGPPVAEKTGKNRWHLDIAPPLGGDQQAEVDRLVALGARRADIGQGDVRWVVMADPDGNEFCVLPPS
jgi:catechol 2,3-dioxygenase-like lactoylglutathione lyase family enzyme